MLTVTTCVGEINGQNVIHHNRINCISFFLFPVIVTLHNCFCSFFIIRLFISLHDVIAF